MIRDIDNEAAYASALRSLWRGVIMQALRDLQRECRKVEGVVVGEFDREHLAAWFTTRDFYYVCDLANMDADYIIERAIRVMNGESLNMYGRSILE